MHFHCHKSLDVAMRITSNDQSPSSNVTVTISPLISLQMKSVSKFELLYLQCTTQDIKHHC